jgi:hypothetical protein
MFSGYPVVGSRKLWTSGEKGFAVRVRMESQVEIILPPFLATKLDVSARYDYLERIVGCLVEASIASVEEPHPNSPIGIYFVLMQHE